MSHNQNSNICYAYYNYNFRRRLLKLTTTLLIFSSSFVAFSLLVKFPVSRYGSRGVTHSMKKKILNCGNHPFQLTLVYLWGSLSNDNSYIIKPNRKQVIQYSGGPVADDNIDFNASSSSISSITTAKKIIIRTVEEFGHLRGPLSPRRSARNGGTSRLYQYIMRARIQVENVKHVLQFLNDLFPDNPSTISEILTLHPRILRRSVEHQLQPVVKFLHTLYGEHLFLEVWLYHAIFYYYYILQLDSSFCFFFNLFSLSLSNPKQSR
jgi:hypothetical protein